MTPTKLLIGQIIFVFAIVLAGVWFATQWAAAELAYQPELGRPWFLAFGHPIYHPWALFAWWFHFNAYAPKIFDVAGSIAAASGFLGCGAAVFGSLWRARQRTNITTYGSARWAAITDIRRAGLFNQAGVFLGRSGPKYLRHDGPEHIMAFAPTRSGKGVGLVVPTLLGWSGSAVTLDKIRWLLGMAYPLTGSHPINAVTPTEALSVLRKVEANGRYESARRMRSVLSRVFRYGIATARCDRDVAADLRGALVQHVLVDRHIDGPFHSILWPPAQNS